MNETIEPPASVKVLLVDDEVNITKSLRRLLGQEDDYEVFIGNSGEEGLELLREESDIGVIISDQRMPQMTGVEFLREARILAPEAIRILLTGYADIEASLAAINQGAVFRYLSKPWQDDELLAALAEAADHFRLISENKRLNALVAKQNAELQDWNTRLKQRVLDQTSQIRAKSDSLAEKNLQLRVSFGETIDALAGLIEMRDPKVPGHSRNTAELVAAMAIAMELPDEEVRSYRSAAMLHDIGKISMSDEVLRKSILRLNEKELIEYQQHVVRGQTAIDPVPELRELGLLIRHHHENYDGSGFPDGLAKQDIPLGARLIAIADCFEHKLHQFAEDVAFEDVLKVMTQDWGIGLDPRLKKFLHQAAEQVFCTLDFSAEMIERMVSPNELVVGMQILQNICSGTGVLLLKRGTVLDEASIDSIQRCFMIDPFKAKITVLIKRK
ncbi:MAG: response regulator [Geopsychrobacter sp.]|nr:response regulator [Geopsychrobacter sp.]